MEDILIEFVFAGAVIFLIWLVLVKCGKVLLVGWVFVATGLIALYIFTPYGYYLTAWNSIWLLGFSAPVSIGFLAKAGALTTMLGAAHLLRRPR